MSIFSYEQTFKDIQQGKESISLICLKCKHNMAVTNYSSFGCQNCQTRYTFESYQLQFNSMFMSLLLNNGVGGPNTQTQQTTTTVTNTEQPKVETPPPPKDPMDGMFDDIFGFDNIKRTLKTALKSERRLHCLINGPPGTGKTIFLQCIKKVFPDAEYIDSTMLTKSGLGSLLLEKKPKRILLDELDKLDQDNQFLLLNLMATGILKIVKHNNQQEYKFDKLQVIATSNDIDKIYRAVKDRFFKINQDPYTKDQFYFIADKILKKKYKYNDEMTKYLIEECYSKINNISMRQLEQVAQLVEPTKTKEDVDYYVNVVTQYSV